MRILAVSDSHGYDYLLRDIFKRENAAADVIAHCGDGAPSMLNMGEYTFGKPVYTCRGNCDSSAYGLENVTLFEVGGKRVLLTHGHLYQAKLTLENLTYAALEKEAQIVLFGHTHEAGYEYYKNVWLINPGCAAEREYAVIDINGDKINPTLKRL